MKEFKIEIDLDGTVTTNLKGYEGKSPELAAIVEAACGKVARVDWNPGAHAHIVDGAKIYHRH